MPNSQGYNVTQSAWAMDADEDFINGPIYTSADNTSYTAGELQNDYSQCFGSVTEPNDYASHFSKIAWTGSGEYPPGSSGPVNMLQLPISPITGSDPPDYPVGSTSAQGIFMPPWNGCGTSFQPFYPTGAAEYLLWGGIINDDQRCGTQLYENFVSQSVFSANQGLDPAIWLPFDNGQKNLRQATGSLPAHAPPSGSWLYRFGGGTGGSPSPNPRSLQTVQEYETPLRITFLYAQGSWEYDTGNTTNQGFDLQRPDTAAGNDLAFCYSTDSGATWLTQSNFAPVNGPGEPGQSGLCADLSGNQGYCNGFVSHSAYFPAESGTVMFRWWQDDYEVADKDNWGLGEVKIVSCGESGSTSIARSSRNAGIYFPNKIFNFSGITASLDDNSGLQNPNLGFMISAWVYPQKIAGAAPTLFWGQSRDSMGVAGDPYGPINAPITGGLYDWYCVHKTNQNQDVYSLYNSPQNDPTGRWNFFTASLIPAPGSSTSSNCDGTLLGADNCAGPQLNYRNCRYTIVSFANQNSYFSGAVSPTAVGVVPPVLAQGGTPDTKNAYSFKSPGLACINLFLEGTYHEDNEDINWCNIDGDNFRLTAEIVLQNPLKILRADLSTVYVASPETIFLDSASTDYIVPANQWSHILFSYGAMNFTEIMTRNQRFAFYVNGVNQDKEPAIEGSKDIINETGLTIGNGAWFNFDPLDDGYSCPGTGAIGVDATYCREGGWNLSSSVNQSVFHGFMDEVAIFPYSVQNMFMQPPGSELFNGFVQFFYNGGCPTNIGEYLHLYSRKVDQPVQNFTKMTNRTGTGEFSYLNVAEEYALWPPQVPDTSIYTGELSPAVWYRHGDLGYPYDQTGSTPPYVNPPTTGTLTNRMCLNDDTWPAITGTLFEVYGYGDYIGAYQMSGNLYAWPGQPETTYSEYCGDVPPQWNRGWLQFTASGLCSLTTPDKSTLMAAPIYNRKHTLGSVFSTMHFGWSTPSASSAYAGFIPYIDRPITMKQLPEITLAINAWSGSWVSNINEALQYPLGRIETCGGNALWESGRLAGSVTEAGLFASRPRNPMYDTYGEYVELMKLKNQKYSLIPEFRISEFIEFYESQDAGAMAENAAQFDIWGLPAESPDGTPANSSEPNFGKIFSHTSFMKHFSIMKSQHKDSLDIDPSTITLTCNALMKFIAYDGFYPSERTLQIANQFSKSYGDSVSYEGIDSHLTKARFRPFLAPFYRPGIMYNSIKAGLACNYPVHQGPYQVIQYVTDASAMTLSKYFVVGCRDDKWSPTNYGSTWDLKVPFEAIVNTSMVAGEKMADMEPHPSSSLNILAQWNGGGDKLHSLMVSNFLAEVPTFFLPERIENSGIGEFSSIRGITADKIGTAQSGTLYGMRIKLYRSTNGPRKWRAIGNPTGLLDYDIPQDPRILNMGVDEEPYKETFTMYSRQSAFGPFAAADFWLGFNMHKLGELYREGSTPGGAGTPTGLSSFDGVNLTTQAFLSDGLMGLNPAYTPGYYSGEAWADILYAPSTTGLSGEALLDDILANHILQQWRIDAFPAILESGKGADGGTFGTNYRQGIWNGNRTPTYPRQPFDAYNANNYAMQIDASINLVGKTLDAAYIIEPKFETPMYNFNDSSVRPLTSASNTLAIPLHGSESVPRGMWHQFGEFPEGNKGVYLSVDDIPQTWLRSLQNRINVPIGFQQFEYYNANNYTPPGKTLESADEIQSLADVLGLNGLPQRLGETAESKTVSEAIIAIPFIEEDEQRKFFAIPKDIIKTALIAASDPSGVSQASQAGNTALEAVENISFDLDPDIVAQAKAFAIGIAAGETAAKAIENKSHLSATIIDMVQKMKKYVLPPRFDFVRNINKIEPFAMYIFEFEHEFNQTDLSYIWQNLPPQIGESFVTQTVGIRHRLLADELMGSFPSSNFQPADIIPTRLQWMVFKVKNRANNNYFSKVTHQGTPGKDQHKYGYNWPYDFFSLVEFANIDVEIGISKMPPGVSGVEDDKIDAKEVVVTANDTTGKIKIPGFSSD